MKVGFVGLGIMGRPMAKNLIRAGHELTVYARRSEVVEEFCLLGASVKDSPAQVAATTEVSITMLPNSPEVREVVLGEQGLALGAKAGHTIIDMSSIDPLESQSIGNTLAEHNVYFMDAPVSGGEPKAIDASLSVMVGSDLEIFNQYKDLLLDMAASVVHVGDIGAGNIAKLANQMIVASNIAVVSEALMFAKKAGADPEKVYQAIRGGLAGSNVLDAKAPMMLDKNFKPGFRIELHMKDLKNVQAASQKIHAPAPLTAQVMEMMQVLAAHGFEMDDHAALLKYYEILSGMTLLGDE